MAIFTILGHFGGLLVGGLSHGASRGVGSHMGVPRRLHMVPNFSILAHTSFLYNWKITWSLFLNFFHFFSLFFQFFKFWSFLGHFLTPQTPGLLDLSQEPRNWSHFDHFLIIFQLVPRKRVRSYAKPPKKAIKCKSVMNKDERCFRWHFGAP